MTTEPRLSDSIYRKEYPLNPLNFITHLPNTKDESDFVTTWVDRISWRVHFIPSTPSENAVDTEKSFYGNVLSFTEYRMKLSLIEIRSSHRSSGPH